MPLPFGPTTPSFVRSCTASVTPARSGALPGAYVTSTSCAIRPGTPSPSSAAKRPFGLAPAMRFVSCPPSTTTKAGIARIWKRAAVAGFSSTLTLTHLCDGLAAASSSKAGSI